MYYFDESGYGWTSIVDTEQPECNERDNYYEKFYSEVSVTLDKLFQDGLLPDFGRIGDYKPKLLEDFCFQLEIVLKDMQKFNRDVNSGHHYSLNAKGIQNRISTWINLLTRKK